MKFDPPKTSLCVFFLLFATLLIKAVYIILSRTQVYSLAETEVVYINAVMKIMFNNMNPGMFFHGPLYLYFISFLYLCLFNAGKILGLLTTNVDSLMLFLDRPDIFYFIGRAVSALAVTATVYLIYRLGKALWDKKTGLLSALLFSFTPMSFAQGTEVSVYALTSFLIVLSALCWVRYIKSPGMNRMMIAGFVFGLALAADYYALFLAPFFMITYIAYLRKQQPGRSSGLFTFCAISLLVFLVLNPYFVLKPAAVWQSICLQARSAIFSEYNNPYGLLRYLAMLFSPAYCVVSAFFLTGIYFAIKNKEWLNIAIFSFPLANIVFFSFSKIQLEHYIFHSLPFISMISASAMLALVRLKKLDFKILALLVALITVLSVNSYKPRRYNKDAWAAKSWIEQNLPRKSAILIQSGTVPFAQSILFHILYDPRSNSNEPLYFSALARYLEQHPEEDYQFWTCNFLKGTIPLIASRNIRYLVLSEKDYDRAGVEWLAKNAVLIKTFSKFGDTWRIRIYQVIDPSRERAGPLKNWW